MKICSQCSSECRSMDKVCRTCFAALRDDAQAERNVAIYQMRKDGRKFREIAAEFGISRQRAHQIYVRQARLHATGGCSH